MHKEINDYIKNPEDDICNFNLGVWYENQNHKSPATSFYLRAAELTTDVDLEYECLLRLYICYKGATNRDYTCENLLKNALKINPKKPEAYLLLSQFYEYKKNWLDSYLYACLGLDIAEKTPSKLKKEIGYESEYMLIFQKAVAAWWAGKPKESRVLFRKLKDEYSNILNDYYFKLVEKNITTLGSGPEAESCPRYSKFNHDLRFTFEGCDEVEKNFSQVFQDLFVLAALNGKKNGTYLEIGSAHSFHNSNTALLEQKFGWTGVGVEMKADLADMHKRERNNKVICDNALKIDYEKILKENFDNKIIDYLQLDIEPSSNTFESLLLIPFDKYKFRVITYEHDHYVDMTKTYREKSRRYLRGLGYTLVFNDIAPIEGCNFEDWWVHKDLVDKSILKNFLSIDKNEINLAKDFILKEKKQ